MELAQYRLLYFQPDPENGDRVCVGLVFEEPNGRSLVYDTEFSKVRCVAPQIDVDMVRFYCEDLRSSLQRDRDSEVALKRYSPQLTTSPRRSIAGPVIESVKERLLHRFATSSRSEQPRMEPSIAAEARKQAAEEIAEFVEAIAEPLRLSVVRNARPEELFGKKVPLIGTVAVGVRAKSGIILIDGVDLKTMTPRRSINAVNKVVHTFWQYGRLRDHDLAFGHSEFQRVGLILNGIAPAQQTAKYRDAHDYALNLFSKEAEMTVDAASQTDTERFSALIGSRASQ